MKLIPSISTNIHALVPSLEIAARLHNRARFWKEKKKTFLFILFIKAQIFFPIFLSLICAKAFGMGKEKKQMWKYQGKDREWVGRQGESKDVEEKERKLFFTHTHTHSWKMKTKTMLILVTAYSTQDTIIHVRLCVCSSKILVLLSSVGLFHFTIIIFACRVRTLAYIFFVRLLPATR